MTVEAPPAVVAPPSPPDSSKDWTSVLVLAGGSADSGEKRPIIVAEVRADDGQLAKAVYPAGADIYFRSGVDGADFKSGVVVTLGVDIDQGTLHGFSSVMSLVHVGPAHPAYAAANLAFLHGAEAIEVRGLSPYWKDRLQPWFDEVPSDKAFPAAVSITLT